MKNCLIFPNRERILLSVPFSLCTQSLRTCLRVCTQSWCALCSNCSLNLRPGSHTDNVFALCCYQGISDTGFMTDRSYCSVLGNTRSNARSNWGRLSGNRVEKERDRKGARAPLQSTPTPRYRH